MFNRKHAFRWHGFKRVVRPLAFALLLPAVGAHAQDTKLADDDGAPQSGAGLAYYIRMVDENPGDINNIHMLAIAHSQMGQHADAKKAINTALAREPENPNLYQGLGLIEEAAKNYKAAEAAFRKAFALAPSVHFRIDIVRVLEDDGRGVEAEKELNDIAFEHADNYGVQILVGEYLREQGEEARAFSAYDRAIKIDGKRPEAYVAKAKALGDKGRNREAIGVLRRGKTNATADEEIFYNLGIALFREREYEAAVQAYEEAAKLNPRMERAFNNMGVAYDKMKKLEKAISAFDKAIAADEDYAEAYYNKGLVTFKLRRFPVAETAFRKALEKNPDMADAKFFLGEIYFQQGNPSKALEIYKEALKTNPDNAGSHRRMGDIYLEQGKLDKAINEYWEAVGDDERNDDNREQLMRVLIARNTGDDMRRAVTLGQEGLSKNPFAVNVRTVLADALSLQQKPLSAEEILVEGVKKMGKNPKAHAALGHHYLGRGKLDKAKVSFNKALKLDKRSADALFGLAVIAQNEGSDRDAEKRLKRVLAIEPGHAQARTDLGCMYVRAGKFKTAKTHLERATKDEPRMGGAWYCLAFVNNFLLEGKKGEDAALTAFKKAVKVQPDLAEAHFKIGEILLKRGDKPGAKLAFAAAVKADRKHEKALVELERLSNVKVETSDPPK